MSIMEFEIKNYAGEYEYVTVLEEFKHHYSGGTMRRILVDYIDEDGRPNCYHDIVSEEQFKKNFLDYRTPESMPIGWLVLKDESKLRITELVMMSKDCFVMRGADGVDYYYNRYMEEDDEVNLTKLQEKYFQYRLDRRKWVDVTEEIMRVEIEDPEKRHVFDLAAYDMCKE